MSIVNTDELYEWAYMSRARAFEKKAFAGPAFKASTKLLSPIGRLIAKPINWARRGMTSTGSKIGDIAKGTGISAGIVTGTNTLAHLHDWHSNSGLSDAERATRDKGWQNSQDLFNQFKAMRPTALGNTTITRDMPGVFNSLYRTWTNPRNNWKSALGYSFLDLVAPARDAFNMRNNAGYYMPGADTIRVGPGDIIDNRYKHVVPHETGHAIGVNEMNDSSEGRADQIGNELMQQVQQ